MIGNFGAFVEIEVSDKVNFGMLITIWLSILENIQRLGVNMPGFLEKYLDDRSFNQKLIDELVERIEVSSKGIIEVKMKCMDVFQKVSEILEK